MRTYRQDSDDTQRYFHDWSGQLDKDGLATNTVPSIASSAWTVAAGPSSQNETINGPLTYIEIFGGSVNSTYKVENKITTSGGLVHTKSFNVLVVNK